MHPNRIVAACLGLLVLVGCSAGSGTPGDAAVSPSGSGPTSSTTAPAPTEPTSATPTTPAPSARFDVAAALHHIQVLAGRIGPRLATGPAFVEAATYVEEKFRAQGYDVSRQRFPVPAGDSWGVPVSAGTSFNVVATPPGFDAGSPYRIVGAHLDTVAVAPGAEDNASGISVLLELARLAAADDTLLPTVLIAFGAEEPRGPAEDQHHYGSRHYVAEMTRQERGNLRAMVSLDRIGVGPRVPVCSAPEGGTKVRDSLLATAIAEGIPPLACEGNTASDHWSFVLKRMPAARVGSTSYAAYHSADDVPSVINRRQLERSGRLIWAWLRVS